MQGAGCRVRRSIWVGLSVSLGGVYAPISVSESSTKAGQVRAPGGLVWVGLSVNSSVNLSWSVDLGGVFG